MPDKEQQVKNLSERVVKEAVGVGLETPMREPILEAIEESGESTSAGKRRLPLAGALLGLGAAIGYLAGRSEHDSLESMVGGEMIEELLAETDVDDRLETDTELGSETEEADADLEAEGGELDDDESAESDSETGSRLLPRLLLGLGVLGALAVIRRRMRSDEGEEWEPIEEFEPAVEFGDTDDDEGDDEADEAEAEGDEQSDTVGEPDTEEMADDEIEE